jgi:hypothetical protein
MRFCDEVRVKIEDQTLKYEEGRDDIYREDDDSDF